INKDISMSTNKALKSGFVEIPGAQLYYEMMGEGDPLLLLHGGALDGRMWDEQFLFFAQQHQVVRYDMRYSGQSKATPSQEPHIPYQDLYHLLQGLALEK